ncbi:MAG: hypothetical protein LBB19_02035 [Puniceicoccales bacterium]|jgi:hypothetical protein|nr:hypothetical protein [Puniceicoccales bacterium]
MALNVDTTAGELSPAVHVQIHEEISRMEIANRCAELGGRASISSIREGIQTYVGLALRDPALAAKLVCDGNFLGFVNGFVGDQHGEEAVHAVREALVAYRACGLADAVTQELKNKLDRFTAENFTRPIADLTVDEISNKISTLTWGPCNYRWGPTFEPYRNYFLEIGSDVPEDLLKENLIKIVWASGEADKILMGEDVSLYVLNNLKRALESFSGISAVTPRQKLMIAQVFTDLYLGNALEAAQGSFEILQDGPLASYCFVLKHTNPYFSEEERQWIADTILRCRYPSPETLRAPLNFSDEAHGLESIASTIAVVNTLGSFFNLMWVAQVGCNVNRFAEDYYLGIDLANRLLQKRNPELEWLSSVEKRQHRKNCWQSFIRNYPKAYGEYEETDEETGWPTGKMVRYSNEGILLYRLGQLYPKAKENILRFFDERSMSDAPASFTNTPIMGAGLSKLQFLRIPGESDLLYRMHLTMDVCKTGTYAVAVGLLAEAPYAFSNATYAAGTLNWVRNYNWLMHQLWPEGITEIPITARHVFFDKKTKKLAEVEFNKLPPYEHTKWDLLSVDAELHGKAVNLKTLTSDPNAPDITFVPIRGDIFIDMGIMRSRGGYNVYIEEH